MIMLKDVRKIFAQAPDRGAKIRTNPVTGGRWVPGEDSTAAQVGIAWRALNARAACAVGGQLGRHTLPLSYAEREALKAKGGLGYAVALFARSLADKKYVLDKHAPFDVYMSGLLARPEVGKFISKLDPGLVHRFPPTPLIGLDEFGLFSLPAIEAHLGPAECPAPAMIFMCNFSVINEPDRCKFPAPGPEHCPKSPHSLHLSNACDPRANSQNHRTLGPRPFGMSRGQLATMAWNEYLRKQCSKNLAFLL